MTKSPITCEDVDVACDLFPKWCDNIYTTPGDVARFGDPRVEEAAKRRNVVGKVFKIDYDLLEKRKVQEAKESEHAGWSIDACEDVTLTGYPDEDMEEDVPTTFSNVLDKPKPRGKGKGKAKAKKSQELHTCESFGSIDELTQHLVPTSERSEHDYVAEIREKLSREGRARVLPEDLVFDIDLPPQQFMVENIYYREDDPIHPLCNPKKVPVWCILGMDRWKFKDLLYSRSVTDARQAASNTHELDNRLHYPDFILKKHFQIIDMKRRQRKGLPQRGVKLAALTSNIASGFVGPNDYDSREISIMAKVLYEKRLAAQRAARLEKRASMVKRNEERMEKKKRNAGKKRTKGSETTDNVFTAHRKSRKKAFAEQIARMQERGELRM